MTEAELLAAFRLIVRDELRAVTLPRRGSQLTADDRSTLIAALPIIAAALGSEPWTTNDLFTLGAQRPPLARALGALSPKQFGKLLARAADVPIGSYMVERVGDRRDGGIWRVLARL